LRILAIDTALGLCSACVFDTVSDAAISSESVPMDRGHAEALMPLIERVINRVEGGFATLDRVAASIGPGSFTGLRVGLAAGRAIGMATDIPVVGVNTLSAFAAPLLGQSSDKWIASVIDARHSHVYLQLMGSDGKLALPPQIISIDDAIVAIGSKPFRIVGSAATLLGTALSEAGQSPEVAPDRAGADIDWIARLGAIDNPEFAPPSPLYLRPPDALPQTNGRIARAVF
jgi:tRNA threonylcarbamoyl adenosine modification protein YeaZ